MISTLNLRSRFNHMKIPGTFGTSASRPKCLLCCCFNLHHLQAENRKNGSPLSEANSLVIDHENLFDTIEDIHTFWNISSKI